MNVKIKNGIEICLRNSGELKESFKVSAFIQDREVGYLIVQNYQNKIYAFDTQVENQFRRLGIATKMYNYAESLTEKKIYPNEYINKEASSSTDAVEFWRARGMILSNGDKIFDC